LLTRLAYRIAAFHEAAKIVPVDDGAARFRRIVEGNVISIAAFPKILDQRLARAIGTELLALTDKLAPSLDQRARSGRRRHAHGDLDLANIALIDGEPTPFDCLEFSAELASIDVLYDLAFLLMDLWQRGLRGQANIVFNRYLDLSPDNEGGMALMPLFLATRATIRAHVLAAQAVRAGGDSALARLADTHLDFALSLLAPVAPRLVAIGGLSGTGKSTLARAIGASLGRAPGARILRSDVLRKRLAGVAPETRLFAEHYSIEASRTVYSLIGRIASTVLMCGQAAIAVARARRDERDAIEAVALSAGARFDGLWLEAPGATLVERLENRGPDASDADANVAVQQSHFATGELGCWRTIPAGSSPDVVIPHTRTLLGIG
jgi:predicted kinase